MLGFFGTTERDRVHFTKHIIVDETTLRHCAYAAPEGRTQVFLSRDIIRMFTGLEVVEQVELFLAQRLVVRVRAAQRLALELLVALVSGAEVRAHGGVISWSWGWQAGRGSRAGSPRRAPGSPDAATPKRLEKRPRKPRRRPGDRKVFSTPTCGQESYRSDRGMGHGGAAAAPVARKVFEAYRSLAGESLTLLEERP